MSESEPGVVTFHALTPTGPDLYRCSRSRAPEVWSAGAWRQVAGSSAFARAWFRSPHEVVDLTEQQARALAPEAFREAGA